MTTRAALLVTILGWILVPASSVAQTGDCSGTLSGAVKASFSCSLSWAGGGQGKALCLTISPVGDIAGVRSLALAPFPLSDPPSIQTYRRSAAGAGTWTLKASDGRVFTATPAKEQGEVELSLDTVERERSAPGRYTVSGTLRVRLVPRDGHGEAVSLEVTF